MEKKPLVVTAVVIRNLDGKYLMGRRRGGFLDNKWCFPGGKVEYNEKLRDTCKREVLEETGLRINLVNFWTWTESFVDTDGDHLIGMVFTARLWQHSNSVTVLEPEKFYEWKWFDWKDIPNQSMTVINEQVVPLGDPFNQ